MEGMYSIWLPLNLTWPMSPNPDTQHTKETQNMAPTPRAATSAVRSTVCWHRRPQAIRRLRDAICATVHEVRPKAKATQCTVRKRLPVSVQFAITSGKVGLLLN